MVVTIINNLISVFFPQKCRGCAKLGQAICIKCLRKIPLATGVGRSSFAVFDYGNKMVRTSIRDLKYHRRSESATILAKFSSDHISEYLAETIQSSTFQKIIFVPIPEHKAKYRQKGFNHSEILAKIWSRELHGNLKNILHKIVFTLPQAKLNRKDRLKNVEHTMTSDCVEQDAIYIVVDDVTTTGATFHEARRALIRAGAKKIFCIALAHGYAK